MSVWVNLRLLGSRILQTRKNKKRLAKLKLQVNDDLGHIDSMPQSNAGKRGTMIVKCDDIGDFLVWQQVLPVIAEKVEKPLVLVANKAIRSLYEAYFEVADEVVWIDKSKWSDSAYRLSLYQKVSEFNVHTAFTPLFTRNYGMDDLLLVASRASEKWAWHHSHHYIYPNFNLFGNRIHQVKSDTMNRLEYFRNIEFVNKVYHLEMTESFKPLFPNFNKHDTLVVVPVASAPSKTWSAENFACAINNIKDQFSRIYIIGGANSIESASIIEKMVKDKKLVNLVNQTQLNELFAFVGEAKLLLTVDTFAAHLGPLCATKTVVIANGTNWQRFGDYEPYVNSGFKLVLPPHVKKKQDTIKKFYNGSEINQIKVENVVKAMQALLTKV